MKIRSLVFLCLGATAAFCQQPVPEDPAGPGRFGPLSLASQFFDNDYFNYYLFANGVYDSYAPVVTSGGNNTGAFGLQAGGGLSAFHRFRRGSFGINYFGSYQNYQSSFFSSGTNQNLNLNYTQRLGRRWTFGLNQGAGILFYGNGYLGSQPTSGTYVQANPFSSETRFVSTNVNMGYLLTRRLSINVSGNFYLQRYNSNLGIGTTGGSGDVGTSYRITARTSISADYGHSYFKYQHGAGDANIDSINGSIFHVFPGHWTVTGSGGFSRSSTSGFLTIPLALLTGNQGIGGYFIGSYTSKSNLPSFFGSVSHGMRRSSLNFSGGQSIVSGNGYYLASRNQFLNGGYSRSYLHANLSAGVNYYRLKSVSNTVSNTYNTFAFGVGYGYTVTKHLSTNFRYDYLRYGYLQPLSSVSDNRLSFGVSYSSKSVPLTLY